MYSLIYRTAIALQYKHIKVFSVKDEWSSVCAPLLPPEVCNSGRCFHTFEKRKHNCFLWTMARISWFIHKLVIFFLISMAREGVQSQLMPLRWQMVISTGAAALASSEIHLAHCPPSNCNHQWMFHEKISEIKQI